MLRRIRDHEGWTVDAQDGNNVGTIRDFYFDDQRWTVRYLVIDAGNWFTGRRIVISLMAIDAIDWEEGRVRLRLTRERIKDAPPAPFERPLTRGYESTFSTYYGYPTYWAGPGLWGPVATPAMIPPPGASAAMPEARPTQRDEQHVRNVREVSGYHIATSDGEIGHVEDFLFDEETWEIRYLIVDTSNWIGGRSVLLSTDWVTVVDWPRRLVQVDVTRDAVRHSPRYDPGAVIDRAYEERLADVYRRRVRAI